jgi:hypothetical protein
LLAAIIAIQAAVIFCSSRRTSLTFDEITFIAGGSRGFATGRFDLVPDHPALIQYLYGLPAYLMGLRYPSEPVDTGEGVGFYRYDYAQALFFKMGNDFEAMVLAARLVALACALLLPVMAYAFSVSRWGPACGLLAAGLTAFLPDVLAHGGVAYSDLPGAVLYFAAVWAAEAMARRPGAGRGALTGLLIALALGLKFSAVLLLPVTAGIVLWEWWDRRNDQAWLYGMLHAGCSLAAAAYLSSFLLYRADPALAALRLGLALTISHVGEGHVAPSYLLGSTSAGGWWYFNLAAFFLKTPAALHGLLLMAAVAAVLAIRAGKRDLRPFRGILVGMAFFAVALLRSHLAIGFRHALPLLPFLCVLAAVGAISLWRRRSRPLRALIAALSIWAVASPLSWYPHFLAFTSEYVRTRDGGHEVLLDSNLDWGQGLIELRDHLRRHGISRVALSYFGSALPEAYGIDYLPFASFLTLPERPLPAGALPPDRFVISATTLHGLYVEGDPFRAFREAVPEAVVAHTLFIYRASVIPSAGAASTSGIPAAR